MLITTEGIVIRERNVGENDKFIDLLTNEFGLIEVSVKGVKKLTSKFGGAVQLFSFARFCMDKRGERYYLNSAESIKVFYDLRLDVERTALAMYFSELVKFTVSSEQPSDDVLRLLLGALHYLSNGKRDSALIKAVLELRLLSQLGFMPDLTACANCGCFEHEMMLFSPQEGSLLCGECQVDDMQKPYFLSPSVLHAMRHIIYCELDRLFAFKLSAESLKSLGEITETYVMAQLDKRLKTLDFYHSVKQL